MLRDKGEIHEIKVKIDGKNNKVTNKVGTIKWKAPELTAEMEEAEFVNKLEEFEEFVDASDIDKTDFVTIMQ